MSSCEPTKAESSSLVELDMLSNLPQDVKEKILTCLPIKEAGRTSILSRKWRYTWASIPDLTLSDAMYDRSERFEKVVDTVLLLHNGPIRKFNLSCSTDIFDAFDKWIVNLSRNGIREITLDLTWQFYEINSNFFSCDALNCIILRKCTIKVPLWFKGFKFLRTLEVSSCPFSAHDLEKLVSSCPLLKILILTNFTEFIPLKICAPNLESLVIAAEFTNLLLCAPKLISLDVSMNFPSPDDWTYDGFMEALHGVPDSYRFESKQHFLSYLCPRPLSKESTLMFNHLKNVDASFDFDDEKAAAFFLALFQSAPHLQSLSINVYTVDYIEQSPVARLWKTAEIKEGMFKHLETVKIVGFRYTDCTLAFVKLILGSAPQLVTMTVKEEYVEDKKRERGMLELFERASSKADVVFLPYHGSYYGSESRLNYVYFTLP